MHSRRNVVNFTPRVRQELARAEQRTKQSFKFTERGLAALELSTKRYEIADSLLPSLICRVGARDRVLYVRRKRRGSGRIVYHRLGVLGDRPLGEYRAEAERVAAELARGKAPGTDLPRRGGVTLGRAFREYLAAPRPVARALRPLTVKSYQSDFATTWEHWAERQVTGITPEEVHQRHLQRSKESPARADGALRVLAAVFKFTADTHGLALPNPAALVARRRAWNKVDRRRSLIPADLVPAWTEAALDLPDDHGAALSGTVREALLMIMVTGLRLREALHLRWDELDLERGRLTLGRDRMKGGAAHELPVPRRTLERLRARRSASEYVFPGPTGAPLDNIPRRYLDRIGDIIGQPFTAHDLRRTVATYLGAHAPAFVVKAVLSHADPSRTADATAGYVNLDVEALRPWLQAWEDMLHG